MLSTTALMHSDLGEIAQNFPDIPSPNLLESEYDRWRSLWEFPQEEAISVTGFGDALKHCDKELFPNIYIILKISAIRPSSTAGNERSFSTLSR